MITIYLSETHVYIPLRVIAKASKNAISLPVEASDVSIKVWVTAIPEKGLANKAVIELFANALRVPKSALRISSGHKNSLKTLEIESTSPRRILKKLLCDDMNVNIDDYFTNQLA